MPPPLTLEEFRQRVCGVCWVVRSKGTQNILSTMLQNIGDFHFEGYSLNNKALPTVVCNPWGKKTNEV